ncbi:MAG: hypothetical protein NC548_06050 [Lachnospiraceae bacterium]|nr:hypothetical protein [Lachnospiraceae bacterium]
MIKLPKGFIIATVVYLITRILRAIGKDKEGDWPIILLGMVAAIIMLYTGTVYLIGLVGI